MERANARASLDAWLNEVDKLLEETCPPGVGVPDQSDESHQSRK
jgi:hypothetical protein